MNGISSIGFGAQQSSYSSPQKSKSIGFGDIDMFSPEYECINNNDVRGLDRVMSSPEFQNRKAHEAVIIAASDEKAKQQNAPKAEEAVAPAKPTLEQQALEYQKQMLLMQTNLDKLLKEIRTKNTYKEEGAGI